MGIRTKLSPLGGKTNEIQLIEQIMEYRTVGTYGITVNNSDYYKVWVIGGGGTGGRGSGILSNGQVYTNGGSGGSGAGFIGEIYLTRGSYSVTVGGANSGSSIGNLIIAGGGTAGHGNSGLYANGTPGSGGVITVNGTIRNISLQQNGNSGNSFTGDVSNTQNVPGGASLYNGWGAGAASNGSPATGYVALRHFGDIVYGGAN